MPEMVVRVDKEVERTEAAAASQPTAAPVGKLRRASDISLKDMGTTSSRAESSEPQPDGPPLTEEALKALWAEMLEDLAKESPRLAEQLKDRPLRLEEEDQFVIEVNSSYMDAEIKPHLIPMLTFMRQKGRRKNLNCKVEVVYEEHEATVYYARDKYDVMVKENSELERFRVLFPDVEL